MISWIKNNSIAVVWMISATVIGALLPNFQGVPGIMDQVGGAVVGLFFSAYLALYLYKGPSGMAALTRLLPALLVALFAGALWYAGFVFPGFILPGLYAGSVSLFVAAVFARLKD